MERVVHPRSAAWKLARERGVHDASLNALGFLLPILDSVGQHVEEFKDEYERVRRRAVQIGTIITILDLQDKIAIWMGVEPEKPRGREV